MISVGSIGFTSAATAACSPSCTTTCVASDVEAAINRLRAAVGAGMRAPVAPGRVYDPDGERAAVLPGRAGTAGRRHRGGQRRRPHGRGHELRLAAGEPPPPRSRRRGRENVSPECRRRPHAPARPAPLAPLRLTGAISPAAGQAWSQNGLCYLGGRVTPRLDPPRGWLVSGRVEVAAAPTASHPRLLDTQPAMQDFRRR